MAHLASLADMDAFALSEGFRNRDFTPSEVLDAVLQRIDQWEPRVNAFSLMLPQAAKLQADASTERWRTGKPLGELDGIPVTIKDLIQTRGWPTLRGSKTVDPHQAWSIEAPVTARLREEGAVIVGKTTTPEFGWKGVCDSALHGTTRNPWNPGMTSGGSSGGAAVAAATGMGCLHVGTDGGGSIRVPSSFCGVFGLKPTFGLVPAFPLSPFGTVAHIGPMTRTVADAARMLNVMARPDTRDWHSQPYSGKNFLAGLDDGIKGLRIAVSYTLGYADVHAEVRNALSVAAKRLADLGAWVEECDPGFQDPTPIFEKLWWSGAANLRRSIPRNKWDLMDAGLQRYADMGEQIGHMDYLMAMDERAALGQHMADFHNKFDVLLTPTASVTAFEVNRLAPAHIPESSWLSWTPFSYPFNLTQQPAASVPCGFSADGMPIGMQIVAAKYRDDQVLRVARAWENLQPFATPNVASTDERK